MKLPNFPVGGGCQCGAVRYHLIAKPLGVYNCYCKDCQRVSGGTHTISVIMKREDVTFACESLQTYDKLADSGRIVRMHGCARCGYRVWNEPLSAPQLLVMKAGTLDDMSWAVPIGSIWTASRPPWVVIDESQPHFPGQPPSREPLFAAWTAALAEA